MGDGGQGPPPGALECVCHGDGDMADYDTAVTVAGSWELHLFCVQQQGVCLLNALQVQLFVVSVMLLHQTADRHNCVWGSVK